MPSATSDWGQAPSLATFLNQNQEQDVDRSIELLVSLLKRRQIKNSRPCAIATTHLLLKLVRDSQWNDSQSLINRIREVGRQLIAAQPREMAVGNIVRRVLGVVREVAETDEEENGSIDGGIGSPALGGPRRPGLPTNISSFSPLHHAAGFPQHAIQGFSSPGSPSIDGSIESLPPQRPQMPSHAGSLFGLFQQPTGLSPMGTPPIGSGAATPTQKLLLHKQDPLIPKQKIDLGAEVCSGIDDLLEELDIVDTQIAESALDHVHSNEIILTHTSSATVQKFLSAAAKKRKFTVIHAEAYPNDHEVTHATIVNGGIKQGEADDDRWKPLTQLGIKVILIPDTAVFGIMSRVNKVIMAPHSVLSNGSLIAAAGASTIALAAKAHRVPVVVLSGVYKLSPTYPFNRDELIEYGDPGKVVGWNEGEFMDGVDVVNPVFDHVDAELVDLYITNLGGHAPSFLYRIVADHYRVEDIDLSSGN